MHTNPPADPMSPTPAEQRLQRELAADLTFVGRWHGEHYLRDDLIAVLASLAEARRERDELREAIGSEGMSSLAQFRHAIEKDFGSVVPMYLRALADHAAVVWERDALRDTARETVDAVRGIGQRYRNDWSDFDGRQLRSELEEATESLFSRISAGTPTEDRENE